MSRFLLNPFNVFGSLVNYFSGSSMANTSQGGGNALLLLAYLMWTNSSSSRRRSRSRCSSCSQGNDNSDASVDDMEVMDSDSENEVKPGVSTPTPIPTPVSTPTPFPTPTSTPDSAADLPNDRNEVRRNGGNRYNLRQRRVSPTPPRRAPRGRYSNSSNDSNIIDLVTIQSQSTSRRSRIVDEESYNNTPRYRRRNNKKATPKRLQKKQLKKKADTEVKTVQGRRGKKTACGLTLNQRCRNIRYCRCCGCEMVG